MRPQETVSISYGERNPGFSPPRVQRLACSLFVENEEELRKMFENYGSNWSGE